MAAGIETVYQDLALCAGLSPAANFFLGRDRLKPGLFGLFGLLGILDNAAMRRETREACERLGVRLASQSARVSTLSGGQRQGSRSRASKAFEEEIKTNHPEIAHLGVQYSHNDVSEASRIVNAAPAKDPDLAGVFATNLNSATGAGAALRQAGKLGEVKMVGFDAGPAQVKQLEDGVVQALIARLPGDIGAKGVEQAVAAVKGQQVTPSIPADATIVAAENVDRPEVQKVLYKAGC